MDEPPANNKLDWLPEHVALVQGYLSVVDEFVTSRNRVGGSRNR